MSDRRLEVRALASLRRRPRNEKLHYQAQLEALKDSIRRFGFRDPLEITEEGEILAGDGRFLAAQELGMEEVPCLVIPGLSPAEIRGYGVVHNQTSLMTGLDSDAVADEFSRLGVVDTDYSSLGFTTDEVLFMLPQNRTIIEDASVGAVTADVNEWRNLVPKVIRSSLTFETEAQQARWEQFVVDLAERYPLLPTLADRLMAFIDETAPEME